MITKSKEEIQKTINSALSKLITDEGFKQDTQTNQYILLTDQGNFTIDISGNKLDETKCFIHVFSGIRSESVCQKIWSFLNVQEKLKDSFSIIKISQEHFNELPFYNMNSDEDLNRIIAEVKTFLTGFVFPFFKKFDSLDSIKKELKQNIDSEFLVKDPFYRRMISLVYTKECNDADLPSLIAPYRNYIEDNFPFPDGVAKLLTRYDNLSKELTS